MVCFRNAYHHVNGSAEFWKMVTMGMPYASVCHTILNTLGYFFSHIYRNIAVQWMGTTKYERCLLSHCLLTGFVLQFHQIVKTSNILWDAGTVCILLLLS